MGDPVSADNAGVADVDRARISDVEPDPKADQKERGDQQPGRRPDGPNPIAAAAKADPKRPAESGRASGGYCSGTETPISARLKKKFETPKPSKTRRSRLATRQRRRQSKRPTERARRSAGTHRGVELVAEGAGVAAGHLPGNLIAGPRFTDLARQRVDDDQGHLLVGGEVADLPMALTMLALGSGPGACGALDPRWSSAPRPGRLRFGDLRAPPAAAGETTRARSAIAPAVANLPRVARGIGQTPKYRARLAQRHAATTALAPPWLGPAPDKEQRPERVPRCREP